MPLASQSAGSFAASPSAAPVANGALSRLVKEGWASLEREDPVRALKVFREVCHRAPSSQEGKIGMAETYLFLGKPSLARRYIETVRRQAPDDQDAMALHVRILIRESQFDLALRMSSRGLKKFKQPAADLMAAHASALFRVQRTDDAAAVALARASSPTP